MPEDLTAHREPTEAEIAAAIHALSSPAPAYNGPTNSLDRMTLLAKGIAQAVIAARSEGLPPPGGGGGELVEVALRKHASIEHSYHEDDNRHPRDFWHVRVSLGDLSSDWISYGQQEAQTQVPAEKQAAEDSVLASVARSLDAFAIALLPPSPGERETVARIIDPSSWHVLDSYLAIVKRTPNAGYDPDAFKDQASLAKADQIIALLGLSPSVESGREATAVANWGRDANPHQVAVGAAPSNPGKEGE